MTDVELLKELHSRINLGRIEMFTGKEGAIFFGVWARYTEMIAPTEDSDGMYKKFMENKGMKTLNDIARRARENGA